MTITSLICLPGLIILPLVAQNAGTINPPAPKKIISYGSGGIDPLLGRYSSTIEGIYHEFGRRISVMIKEGE